MNRIEVDGGTVSYQVDGHGPGLVMVHGTGGDSRSNWDLLVPAFADDWTVVRPDYTGSGQTSDAGGALDVRALAAQVVSAARASGAVPFDLVGFSLGAAVAAVIAADYPDLVRRVVLLGAFLSSAAPRQRLQFGLWRDLIRTDRQAMARLILLTGFSPAHLAGMGAADIDAAIASIVADTRWDGMARQVELDLTVDVAGAAGRIRRPALVIGCAQDQMVPPAEARAVAAAIPGARYIELDSGHLAPLERPDALIAHFRAFFREAPTSD